MADKLNTQQRHHCMSRIRGKNTKPEILVRKGLHARGFRFRLQDRRLPGRPDIVLPKYGVAIMVNGCFWHGHKGCRYATKPKTNIEFWETKITRNRHRDEVTTAHLEALGWTVITIWECELRTSSLLDDRLNTLAEEIRRAYETKRIKDRDKRQSRVLARKEREELLQRRAKLEAEIYSLYPIPKRVKDASEQLSLRLENSL